MSQAIELTAAQRQHSGSAQCKRMRREEGRVPAIVYGGGQEPQPIELIHKDIMMALANEAVYSSILTLKVDSKTQKVVLKEVQRHPFKPKIIHLDFMRINPKEKLTMSVPLHFVNEATAKGVKTGGGTISHMMIEVEVKCLPGDLPEFIEVDVADLELDQSLHLSDIKLPKGVEFAHAVDGEHDQPIVSIHKSRGASMEEELAAPEAEEAGDAASAGEEG